MLVLSRRINQSIKIGDDIEIMIVDVRDNQVRVGVSAPRDVAVHRKEIYLLIQQENKKAAETGASDEALAAAIQRLIQSERDQE